MEYLIKEAFAHIEVLGTHVADGNYDLLNESGEIILPHVWEAVIKPGETITMQMWPMMEDKPQPGEVPLPDMSIDQEGKLFSIFPPRL